jgi:hypothetical protein
MHEFYAPYGVYGNTAAETFELSDDSKRLRRYFEEYFMANGSGPDFADITSTLEISQSELWDALYQLERGVQVMFVPGTEDIIKMPPFSYVPTRHRVSVGDARRWYAGCAGEASAINGLFPGRTVTVNSRCPDCYEPIVLQYKDRSVLSVDPADSVIHIGIRPEKFRENWLVTCDSINFFRSPDHVKIWEDARPEARGIHFPASLGAEWVNSIAQSRYWNYDRGPDVAQGSMIESFRAMGVDITPWEDRPLRAKWSRNIATAYF